MDEVRIKELSRLVLKITIICICFYLVFINIEKIGNVLLWMFHKLKPFIIGIVIAVVLDIPLNMIEEQLSKKGIKNQRTVSIILSLLCTLGILVVVLVLILPELYHATKMIFDVLFDTLNQLAYSKGDSLGVYTILKKADIDWLEIKNKMEIWVESSSGNLMYQMLLFFKDTASSLVTFFIALVFSIYVLANKETLKRQTKKILSIWCSKRVNAFISYITNLCINTFNLFMVGQVTEAIILGVLCGVGMAILRIPYALMIGVLIGVTALIPYIGAIIGQIVGFILIFVVDPFKAMIFFVYVLILQQIEGNLIYPKVVGNKIKLAPIWVFFAVSLGGSIAGPLGIIFSVPLVSVLYTLIKEETNRKEKEIKSGVTK